MKKLIYAGIAATALTIAVSCPAFAEQSADAAVIATVCRKKLPLSGVLVPECRYAKSELTLYSGPDEGAAVVRTAQPNEELRIIPYNAAWSLAATEQGFAYVKADLLAEKPAVTRTYSEEELSMMAHVLAGEAQDLPDEEQLYVGSVVLNRVKHSQFPDSIKSVIFQKGQYACTWDGNYYREPTARNWANAKRLLESGSVLPEHVIWQSRKRQGKGVYVKTRYHYYCY